MKKIILIASFIFASSTIFAQASGNINYQTQLRFPEQNINIGTPSTADIYISVKGLANVKADSYVAIFSTTQVGKTTEEVNELIDKRIDDALKLIKQKPNVETFVDMISFVPVYELESEKKVFSKRNYNEVPKGFELKKNIHIEYKNQDDLNDFIGILANQEIYDLVRVDYFSTQTESIKKQLMTKAKTILKEKQKNYEELVGGSFAQIDKNVSDGYRVVLPVEMYKSYQSYSSSSLNLRKGANVNIADKSTTLYYQPIIDKEFDFVINPTILEPVIQVMYEVKLVIKREKKKEEKTKEYIFITPNGDLKNMNIGN